MKEVIAIDLSGPTKNKKLPCLSLVYGECCQTEGRTRPFFKIFEIYALDTLERCLIDVFTKFQLSRSMP